MVHCQIVNYKKDETGCSLDLVYNFMDIYILKVSKNSEVLKERWNKYQRNFSYAEGIEFEDIMNFLEIMIEQFETVGV